jgi:hypothetical protein
MSAMRHAAFAFVLGACNGLTGPGARDELALIRYYEDDAEVALPETVAAGSPVPLVVGTFGGGCVRGVARAEVHQIPGSAGRSVVVRLFNRNTGAHACTDDLLVIEHRVSIPTSSAGTLTIRIEGANRGRDTNSKTVSWAITRTVVVQ